MNKKMILPLISFALLVGAMLLAAYFKSMEKNIERQKVYPQNEAANQQKDNLENSENEQTLDEEFDILEEDMNELENLVNDSDLDAIDSDLGNF